MSSSDRESPLNAVRNAIAITEMVGGSPSPSARNCCRPTSTATSPDKRCTGRCWSTRAGRSRRRRANDGGTSKLHAVAGQFREYARCRNLQSGVRIFNPTVARATSSNANAA
jgi:hypothetical protein